jgi:hypothetical protein
MRGEGWAIQVASQQVMSGGPVHRRATHAICGRSAGRKSRRGTCVHHVGSHIALSALVDDAWVEEERALFNKQ